MGNPNLDDWSHAVPGKADWDKRQEVLSLIDREIERSYRLHGCPRWGRHEALATIMEEFEEIKEAVFNDLPYEELLKELIQTAAMCVRYIETEPNFRLGDDDAGDGVLGS